jgi:hypothetical protein
LIGGNVRKNATIASTSSGAKFAYQAYGIVWLSLVPSGRTPSTRARLISSSLHLPMPCSGSEVMLRLTTTPAGGASPLGSSRPRRRHGSCRGAAPARRSMAQHAMPEGGEVTAVAYLIVARRFGDLGDGRSPGRRQRDFVLGPPNWVVDRRKAMQIGGDRRRVLVRQIAVDDNRHRRPDDRAVGPRSRRRCQSRDPA